MTAPDCPFITLRSGDWEVLVADPRPNPFALGGRYVHGGYIHRVRRGERVLTGRAKAEWNPFDGEGMPEVFEHDIGFTQAAIGETYLRLGAGRQVRDGMRPKGLHAIDVAVRWELAESSDAHCVMRCRDAIARDGAEIAYELTRTVRVRADGLDSTTTLALRTPWNHPLNWFPHAFWAHSRADATAYRLPDHATATGMVERDAEGWWRVRPRRPIGGLGIAKGVWGHVGPVDCRLDDALGGGAVRMTPSYPWDHVVLWASPMSTSAEPILARMWPRDDAATWSVAYTWIG